MTNTDIIKRACKAVNFPYNGSNLFTFDEWIKRGYTVKKGEKTFLRVKLWINTNQDSKTTYPKVWARLFTINQVVPLEVKTT